MYCTVIESLPPPPPCIDMLKEDSALYVPPQSAELVRLPEHSLSEAAPPPELVGSSGWEQQLEGVCSVGLGSVPAWTGVCACVGWGLCLRGLGVVPAWAGVCVCVGWGLCLPGLEVVPAWLGVCLCGLGVEPVWIGGCACLGLGLCLCGLGVVPAWTGVCACLGLGVEPAWAGGLCLRGLAMCEVLHAVMQNVCHVGCGHVHCTVEQQPWLRSSALE